MKKILSVILALTFVFALVPGSTLQAAGYVIYENPLSGTADEIRGDANLTWMQPDQFTTKDGKMMVAGSTWTSFGYATELGDVPYTYSIDMKSTVNSMQYLTGVLLGVRKDVPAQNFSTSGGFYASFKGRRVDFFAGAPGDKYITIENMPASLSSTHTIFVEDEGYKISYYIGVDANNKVLIAYGEFDYDTVEMFDANGKSLGTLACQLPDTGYMNVMSHFATAELSNLVISEGCEGPKSGPKVEVVPDPPVMTKEETDSTMKYVYDFNTTQNAVENYVDFMGLQMNNWKVADSKITCTDDNWADIAFTQAASFTGGYEMTMDFSVKTAPDSGNINSFALGMRLSLPRENFVAGPALWAFIKEDQMMFAKGGGFADETTCVMIDNMPADFSQDNSILYVKDNGDDTLEYFADVNGKKTAVAKAVINDDAKTVDMFDGSGSLAGTIKDIELQKTGSVKIMPHYSNSTVDCITFEVDKSTLGDFVQVNPLNYRDNYADTWIATDNLGRRTPMYGEVSAMKDRKFGIYYFPWFTKDQKNGIVDHTKSYQEGGADKMWADFLTVPEGYLQYWSEPYFGYYQTEDDFVIRRHATMLANAGVDFVALDVSNGVMFPEEHEKIFRIWSEMRNQGNKTPQFVFLCGELPEANVSNLKTAWGMWYRDGKYEDLWFKWDGKPVVLANPDNITDQELLDFFTFRRSWAYKDWTGTGVNKWPWIDSTPQAPGYDENGNLEAISVACGFHANGSTGRSFHNGEQPTDGKNEFEFGLMDTTTPQGLAFQEQWDYAMTVDAPLVMICGWNEWAAGCWTQGVAGQKIANTYMWDPNDARHKYFFVDNFNTEFSRDVEPMKGGFEDNYYYQMVQNIRKYRGARPVPAAAGQKTITFNGDFSQWDGVFPEYRDTLADVYHRDYDAVGGQGPHYTNTSGRNDIDYAKVSKDADYTYFYVRTTNDLTAPEGELWMNLFVNSDCQYGTGWKGYDFRINKSQNGSTCTIEKTDSTWEGYQVVGWAEFQYAGNQLQIKVPNSILNLAVEFEFKWADNSVSDGDAMKFWDMGDTAPDGKANYLYTPFGRELEFTPEATAALNGAVAMSVKKYNAFSGTKQVCIDPENSNVTPTIVNDRTMVPVRFVTENLNGQVEYNGAAQKITVTAAGNTIEMTIGKKQLVVNGKAQELDAAPCIIGDRTFLPLRALAEAMGKKVTWERRGLIIIGDAEVTDEAVLDEIYRLM